MATEAYKKYPEEKVVGFFRGTSPELVVRDPEIIKRVLVADFNCFYARGFNPHKKVIEPLLKNLFFADGDLWKLIDQTKIYTRIQYGKIEGHVSINYRKSGEITGPSRRHC